jgi:hypothetical protein
MVLLIIIGIAVALIIFFSVETNINGKFFYDEWEEKD